MKDKNVSKVFHIEIKQILDFFYLLFTDEFDIPGPQATIIVEKHLSPFVGHLKETLFCVIEYPYVDKMHRDVFYRYYSSKLHMVERETIRISFFSKAFEAERFRDEASMHELQTAYRGFLVVRPTFPKIIGRSAISPNALKDDDILCCKAPIRATADALKFEVLAFPHASQDGQAMSCAETTIWSLLEYFGNKYPEYKPALPSEIMKLLQRFSYKRQIPSEGLTVEQVAFAVKELGFGTMIYARGKYKEDFDFVVSTFIESGIPIIAVLKKDSLAHALNIVGRRKDDLANISQSKDFIEIDKGLQILDYNNIQKEYVVIDDNFPPYQMTYLKEPAQYYPDSKWHGSSVSTVIVPLYHKIYLDPIRARKNFLTIMKHEKFRTQGVKRQILKTFLASSRSYKTYIALNVNLDDKVKRYILTLPMPKFVWIAELSFPEAFEKGKANGILIQDATEPVEHSDETYSAGIPVFFGYIDDKVFHILPRKTMIFTTFATQFENYRSNLN